ASSLTTLQRAQLRVLSQHLIDASMSGCAMTMRVGQAMESLQGLLYGLRTGKADVPWQLGPATAPDFDEDWTWLGSYATWRAAMFVFLYPENILLPVLRPQQTPVFVQIADELRNVGQVSPEDACQAAKTYSNYFGDILSLETHVSCQATARVLRPLRCQ